MSFFSRNVMPNIPVQILITAVAHVKCIVFVTVAALMERLKQIFHMLPSCLISTQSKEIGLIPEIVRAQPIHVTKANYEEPLEMFQITSPPTLPCTNSPRGRLPRPSRSRNSSFLSFYKCEFINVFSFR